MTQVHQRTSAKSSVFLDIVIEAEGWRTQPDAESVIRNAVTTACDLASRESGEVAIVLTDDSAIRALNRTWRNRDEATNVLSFPGMMTPTSVEMRHLGDIAIAFETVTREAKDEQKPFAHHLAHLAVHGYLHLLGYDHEIERDAATMEKLETEILARLDIPDPYRTTESEA